MIGAIIEISGMRVEVLEDEGESWMCRNLTTRQTLAISKAVIDRAIRLGQAEMVPANAVQVKDDKNI